MNLKIYNLIFLLAFFYTFINCTYEKAKNKNLTLDSQAEVSKNDISDNKSFIKTTKTEEYLYSLGLVNIQDSLPGIIVDLKYSGSDNFLGFAFYKDLNKAFVQPECFQKLKIAYSLLQDTMPGFTFIIYDAVRSVEAQYVMWDSIKVPHNKKHWYVANPKRGSIHNYGMAIDLTIADETGKPLDMGTSFDFFGELAVPDKTEYFFFKGELSIEQYRNRKFLIELMEKSGFYVSKTEWWHFNASSLDYAKSKYVCFSEKNIENVNKKF